MCTLLFDIVVLHDFLSCLMFGFIGFVILTCWLTHSSILLYRASPFPKTLCSHIFVLVTLGGGLSGGAKDFPDSYGVFFFSVLHAPRNFSL